MVSFESLGTVSFLHSMATIAVSLAVSKLHTNATDRYPATQPDRHRTTAQTSLTHSIARQKSHQQALLTYWYTSRHTGGVAEDVTSLSTQPGWKMIDMLYQAGLYKNLILYKSIKTAFYGSVRHKLVSLLKTFPTNF